MKKLLFSAMVLINLASFAQAQGGFDFKEFASGLKWRAEAGLNFSNINASVDTDFADMNVSLKNKIGARLSFIAEYNLNDKYYLLGGIQYKNRGAKMSIKADKTPEFSMLNFLREYDDNFSLNVDRGATMQASVSLHYLSLPLGIGLKQNLSDNFSLRAEASTYFAYLLAGKSSLNIGGKTSEYDATISKEADSFIENNLFEFGINLSAALVYQQKYFVRVGYDKALRSMVSIKQDVKKHLPFINDISVNNRSTYISLGMYF